MEDMVFYFMEWVATPWLDFLMVILSETCIYVVILIAINFLYGRKKVFPGLVLSVLGSMALGTMLKFITKWPRPCESSLTFVHSVFVNGVLYCRDSIFPFEFGTSSFPSVHAAILFAILPFTAYDRRFFVGFLCYAVLTSMSRVYLGVHYPHDVLAGAVMGVLIGEFVMRKFQVITLRIPGFG